MGGLHAETPFGTTTTAGDTPSIIQDTGVANRLAVAGVLRSLTQEIPAAACHLYQDVNAEDARDLLSTGVDQTTELLDALLNGDIFWGVIAPETRRKTITEIEQLRSDWAPIHAASRRLLSDPSQQQDANQIVAAAEDLFDTSYALLTTLDAQYSNSAEILSRDVMSINLAGRMTALNQGMALKACQLWSSDLDPVIAANLKQEMQDYEGSLKALSDGYAAMGILPPETPGLVNTLAEIGQIWDLNRQLLALVAAGEEISEQQRFDLYYNLIDERVLLLDLVYLYQDNSKVAY
ncbi:type IV pili methyl-accepting chemotaxis transducer N-terminal domain-containing protein [Yoonia sp. GPGPB17]|uniref:type IV pili methyl-accepting chemotaxis transducer N-terminal domain-containing protein n=1 Tax=Yoonia sp. GPGPB17 TaxID=3026147 RepID=UPI0030EBBB9D